MRVLSVVLFAALLSGCIAPTAPAPAQPTSAVTTPSVATAPSTPVAAAPASTSAPRPTGTPIPEVAQFLPGARLVGQWNTPQIAANAPELAYGARLGGRATLQRFEIGLPNAQVTIVDVLRVNAGDPSTGALDLIKNEAGFYSNCAGPAQLSDTPAIAGATCVNRAGKSVDMLVGYTEREVLAVTLTNAEPSGETANSAYRMLVRLLGG